MTGMSSVAIAISWCLAWGNGREPQNKEVIQQMREALKNDEEFPEEVNKLVQQAQELDGLKFPNTVEELKQLTEKYPQFWESEIGLVYGGVTKVKQYVFESAKIQEVRGASGLLDRINLVDLPAFFNQIYQPASSNERDKNLYTIQCNNVKKWLNDNFNQDYDLSEVLIPELIIYSTGGNILAFCPAAYVHDLADAIEKRYTHETLTANSCAVGDTFRLLEIRFGLLKEKIEDTPWLDWYQQNYQKPIVQAYFGFPKNENERLEVFQNRKSFNEITTKLAILFNQRRSGNITPGRHTNRRYPMMFETHPYLVRDGSDRRSTILKVNKNGREVNFSEASVRKFMIGNRAKKGHPEEPSWYQKSNLEWRVNRIEKWVDRFDVFLAENPSLKNKYYGENQSNGVEIAQTLRDISNASNDYIAYIYADGNNMGGYIQKIRTPEEYKTFSQDISLATEYAVYYALAEHLHPHKLKGINDEESELENGDLVHPFEIITIGGDDIFIIVPANKALEISKTIAEKFEEILLKEEELVETQSSETKDKCILGNYKLDTQELNKPFKADKIHRYQPQTAKRSECRLSTSIGVLITADDTPIYYAKGLTDQLLKSAKEQAKKLKNPQKSKYKNEDFLGYYGGTIDFLTLKSVTMIASSIKEFRKEALTRENTQKLKLYAAPYTLHEIGGLLKSIAALKKAKFPKSQLYQIRSLLERGKHTAILNYRYFRVRLKQGKAELKRDFEEVWCLPKDENNNGNLAPWMYEPEEKIYETIWRDMVDIYEFVEEPASEESDKSENLTAGVES